MAGEGKNKVASSLLDLQPTAILELFRVYPDRVNKPSLFVGFHGGSIFNKSIKWQGLQYLPLAIESEGFDILGDGKLPRPKIRVANKNNIITNLLQNFKDFKNAKVIRKKVQVKFLDDDNFDGGNPFGVADSKAELLDEEWIMGRKTQESKIFVEFELNSPLDLENFSVNSRGIQAKFCYWQYRGEGCRYQGMPVEREDGAPFLNSSGSGVVPQYTPLGESQGDFWSDESIKWNTNTEYTTGNIVTVESPTILLPPYEGGDVNASGVPLKTVYVSVAENNAGNHPEKNPSYWQKDGCTKKLDACQRRFNTADNLLFKTSAGEQNFSGVKLSGVGTVEDSNIPMQSGIFHTEEPEVTGVLTPTGEWTIVGWANINQNSPKGAGLFSTSQADETSFPACRFVNILRETTENALRAEYFGYNIDADDKSDSVFRHQYLSPLQPVGDGTNEEWHQYIIRHTTGTAFINGEENDQITLIEFLVDGHMTFIGDRGAFKNPRHADARRIRDNLGNFASYNQRTADFNNPSWPDDIPMLPQTFMIGGVEYFRNAGEYPAPPNPKIASINGHIGMWGLWNRALKEEEVRFLRKTVIAPWETTDNSFTHVPRLYEECIGLMGTLTGGTGDGLPEGTAPLLYGEDSLVAWWDGTTGESPTDVGGTGLMDRHTGEFNLTGSGQFSGVAKTYQNSATTAVYNPTPPNPRFGGFPGTDGFRYGGEL